MKPTCSTCRYWDGCSHSSEGKCNNPIVVNDRISVDAMGGGYEVFFKADFGCIHWSAKEQQPATVHQGFVPPTKEEIHQFLEWMGNHKVLPDEVVWFDDNKIAMTSPPQWLVERWRRST